MLSLTEKIFSDKFENSLKAQFTIICHKTHLAVLLLVFSSQANWIPSHKYTSTKDLLRLATKGCLHNEINQLTGPFSKSSQCWHLQDKKEEEPCISSCATGGCLKNHLK